jgi:hypothetical protein
MPFLMSRCTPQVLLILHDPYQSTVDRRAASSHRTATISGELRSLTPPSSSSEVWSSSPYWAHVRGLGEPHYKDLIGVREQCGCHSPRHTKRWMHTPPRQRRPRPRSSQAMAAPHGPAQWCMGRAKPGQLNHFWLDRRVVSVDLG